MVSQINLGSIFQSGGKNVVGGSASGIDTEAIVKSLVEAKSIPVTNLKDKIDKNTKITAAYTEFKKDLTSLQDAATLLRNKIGVNNAADNIFKYRAATVTANTGVTGSNYLSVTAQPGAPVGNYAITVDRIATRNIKTTNTFALANTGTAAAVGSGGPFNAGTLTIGASATAITLEDGDSLADVVSKVNAQKNATKIEASIVQVSTGNYRLAFKSTTTGADVNYDFLTPNAAVLNIGLSNQVDAVNAQVTIDNTQVERQTNAIDDLVSGMTFNLANTTPSGTTLDLNIDTDQTLVKQGITNLVNAYNNLKLFVSKQTAIGEDGLPTEDAMLSNNSSVQTIMSKLNSALGTNVSALAAGDPTGLAGIGITFSDYSATEDFPFTRNILTIDDDKLTSALATNMDAVQHLFEFQSTTDSSHVSVYENTRGVSVSSLSLAADPTNPDSAQKFIATYVDANGATQTTAFDATASSTGYTLKGKAGTPFDGLTLLFSGNAAETANVTLSQGLGDSLFRGVDSILSANGGILTTAMESLTNQSDRYQTQIDRLNDQIERYRQQLLDKYSALEASISAANTLLQQLAANQSAQEAASG